MTPGIITNDAKSDRSDVLSLLTTITDMFHASRNTLNEYSRTSLLQSIAIEGQMLLMKLRTMYERWQTHLPFKEACGVDFYEWTKQIDNMCQQIDIKEESSVKKIDAYCPSKHFLLDLYAMLPKGGQEEAEPYYKETSIPEFIHTQERMRKTISSRWPEYRHRLSEHTLKAANARKIVDLNTFYNNSDDIQILCHSVLLDLTTELSRLSDMSLRVIKGDEYARLAERIVYEPEYEGQKARREAQTYFSKWKNGMPEEQADAERKYEIDIAVNLISELKYGRFLGRYVHLKDDMQRQMKGIGKFLYTYRLDISIDELRHLMELLYRIHFFLEDERNSKPEGIKQEDVKTIFEEAQPSASPSRVEEEKILIDLPTFFDHSIRAHVDASIAVVKKLRLAGKYMGRNLTKKEKELPEARPYVRWMWHYLMQALKEMGIIDMKTTQVEFSDFMAQLLDRKKENIRQSIYRNCDKKNPSVIEDIKDEFREVRNMMR